jgi:hypothetical protein
LGITTLSTVIDKSMLWMLYAPSASLLFPFVFNTKVFTIAYFDFHQRADCSVLYYFMSRVWVGV